MKKTLLVGGTWDQTGGAKSGLVRKIENILSNKVQMMDTYNGGYFKDLTSIIKKTDQYDVVFWFANIPDNTLEKIRDVKSIAPYTLLVTSKRNDFIKEGEKKYNFEELIQRALSQKANLSFEFTKNINKNKYEIRVYDPLGCLWYQGYDIETATQNAISRIEYMSSVTRKESISIGERIDIIPTDRDIKFLEFVKQSAETFHKLMLLPDHVDRFVGNASLRFNKPTRCMNGFPGIRKNDTILISKRNVDKTGITFNDFVPCKLGEKGEVTYLGNNKPSVDTPVQLRLFSKLKNIDYILHGHCYVKDAPITKMAIPCGALEEIDEVMECIQKNYKEDSDFIVLNLLGHGCLVMAGENKLNDMASIDYIVRTIPERMINNN